VALLCYIYSAAESPARNLVSLTGKTGRIGMDEEDKGVGRVCVAGFLQRTLIPNFFWVQIPLIF